MRRCNASHAFLKARRSSGLSPGSAMRQCATAGCASALPLYPRQISHPRFDLDLHTDIGKGEKNILRDK